MHRCKQRYLAEFVEAGVDITRAVDVISLVMRDADNINANTTEKRTVVTILFSQDPTLANTYTVELLSSQLTQIRTGRTESQAPQCLTRTFPTSK
jgi:hypothetical protein